MEEGIQRNESTNLWVYPPAPMQMHLLRARWAAWSEQWDYRWVQKTEQGQIQRSMVPKWANNMTSFKAVDFKYSFNFYLEERLSFPGISTEKGHW